jgi:hypothetical protein
MPKARKNNNTNIPAKFIPQFLEDADGRCSVIKELKRRYDILKADTGADSYQKDLLVQRATFVGIQLETIETVAAETGRFESGSYGQLVNTFIGLLKALGLERKRKSVVNLNEYMQTKNKKRKKA